MKRECYITKKAFIEYLESLPPEEIVCVDVVDPDSCLFATIYNRLFPGKDVWCGVAAIHYDSAKGRTCRAVTAWELRWQRCLFGQDDRMFTASQVLGYCK